MPPEDPGSPCRPGLRPSRRSPLQNKEDMMGKDYQIHEKDRDDKDLCDEEILVDAKKEEAQGGQGVFEGEEIEASTSNQVTHQGIDLPGPFVDVEDGEVGIKHREYDDEQDREEEQRPIPVHIGMDSPVSLPPYESPPSLKEIPAQRRCLFLAPVGYPSSFPFQFAYQPLEVPVQEGFQKRACCRNCRRREAKDDRFVLPVDCGAVLFARIADPGVFSPQEKHGRICVVTNKERQEGGSLYVRNRFYPSI